MGIFVLSTEDTIVNKVLLSTNFHSIGETGNKWLKPNHELFTEYSFCKRYKGAVIKNQNYFRGEKWGCSGVVVSILR